MKTRTIVKYILQKASKHLTFNNLKEAEHHISMMSLTQDEYILEKETTIIERIRG